MKTYLQRAKVRQRSKIDKDKLRGCFHLPLPPYLRRHSAARTGSVTGPASWTAAVPAITNSPGGLILEPSMEAYWKDIRRCFYVTGY